MRRKLKKNIVIYFCTNNRNKLEEARNIAKDYLVKIVWKRIKLPEIMEIDEKKF